MHGVTVRIVLIFLQNEGKSEPKKKEKNVNPTAQL